MQRHHVGKHSFVIDGDTLFVRYVAAVTLDELLQMDALARPILGDRSPRYLVYDVSDAGLMTPAARRYAAEASRELRSEAIVIHGATVFTRAAIALVLSAARLFAKNLPETVYVHDEAAARAFIAQRRSRTDSRADPPAATAAPLGGEPRGGQ
jgi:hypothetical protein